jgi:hypothetical protein
VLLAEDVVVLDLDVPERGPTLELLDRLVDFPVHVE